MKTKGRARGNEECTLTLSCIIDYLLIIVNYIDILDSHKNASPFYQTLFRTMSIFSSNPSTCRQEATSKAVVKCYTKQNSANLEGKGRKEKKPTAENA